MARFRRIVLIAGIAAFGLEGVAQAEQRPADQLLHAVPGDVQFCLLISDLGARWRSIRDTDFPKAFASTPVGRALTSSSEYQRLERLEPFLREHLNTDWERFRDGVLGSAIVLAFREGSGTEGDPGEFLLGCWVTHEGGAGFLFDALARDAEQGKFQEFSLGMNRYFGRVNKDGKSEYVFHSGNLFLASNSGSMLREALNRPGEQIVERFRSPELADRSLVWWLNPRAFDALIDAEIGRAVGGERAFLIRFRAYWSDLESAAFFADVTDHVEFGLSLRNQINSHLLRDLIHPSPLAWVAPEDALAIVTLRTDLTRLAEGIAEFLTEPSRRQIRADLERWCRPIFGRTPIDRVADSLGPDWGFWLRDTGTQAGRLPETVFVTRLTGDAAESLRGALHLAALFGVADLQHLSPAGERFGPTSSNTPARTIFTFGGGGRPGGVRPSVSLIDGWLVFGSMPEAVAAITLPKNREPVDGPATIARIDVRALAGFIERHPELIDPETATYLAPALRMFGDLSLTSESKDRSMFQIRVRVTSDALRPTGP